MYKNLRNYLFKLDPEVAHNNTERALHLGEKYIPFFLKIFTKTLRLKSNRLEQELFDINFPNPVGLAAGFDKNAYMLYGLSLMGFGHIEYGTVTPKPQSGNEKPRLFRYPKEKSIQNAMGFNNDGLEKVVKNVKKYRKPNIPLGASIGKNKNTPNEKAIEDYEILFEGFKNYCDYFAINISSPNTKGLRDLQNEEFIKEIFIKATDITSKPILLKLSPDMEIDNALSLCEVAVENGASGIIATNTTQDYSLLNGAKDFGGLSGEVLREKSCEFFQHIGKVYHDKTVLISVGGIDSGKEAYRRIKAGASLVQIYTGLIFNGPALVKKINKQLLSCLEKDGFSNISEAIGSSWK